MSEVHQFKTLTEVRRNDVTVDDMMRRLCPRSEIIVCLANQKAELQRVLLAMDGICPRRIKTADGKTYIYHAPDHLIP